jgi:16S rRNA (cytosine1402-N4)-methyltransferase
MEALDIKENGIYVDVTFGGGGHSRAILERIGKGKLIAFDQDPDAWNNKIEDERFTLVRQNFRNMLNYLKYQNLVPVNGILADLGISSRQIDDPGRGFSTRFDHRLDMRMSQAGSKTAGQVINEYTEKQLQHIFSSYGEIRNSKTLASAIVNARSKGAIETVNSLKEILASLVSPANRNQYYAQVFQAIRIEVNDELEALKELLVQSSEALLKGGRLVVMSYHSLEDRLVKNFISQGKTEGEAEKDVYGNRLNIPFRAINKKPVTPSEAEIKSNPRSRSAKLRIAEKL